MISKKQLNELFLYEDGVLYWKNPKSNRLKIGDKAGAIAPDKRERICLKGKLVLTHRVIFAFHHCYWPKYVDHIDCNKANNKIENLRETTVAQNQWNRGLDRNNTSGIKGVYYDKSRNKWAVGIRKNNQKIFLGRFDTLEEAKKQIELHRIEIHGEFARHF
jgi:hypothetical protein